MSVKSSATHRLLASIWQVLFGKSTGHAFPKIAGLFLVGVLSFQQSSGQQLLDNFNDANSNTVGTGVIGSAWTEVENSSSYAQIFIKHFPLAEIMMIGLRLSGYNVVLSNNARFRNRNFDMAV
ncbi:MAG: hypothetical protein IPP27_18790 [Bacteroidetes bacterium]|nr:hypothetical protein [Bacteroidota bacterium]